jgi:hypothetical protein
MAKYKITQKGDTFFVYRRVLFFFWVFENLHGNLHNAKREVEYLKTKEKRVL